MSGCGNVLRSAGHASTTGGNALSAQVNALSASGNAATAPDDVSTASGNVLRHVVNGLRPTGNTLTARSEVWARLGKGVAAPGKAQLALRSARQTAGTRIIAGCISDRPMDPGEPQAKPESVAAVGGNDRIG